MRMALAYVNDYEQAKLFFEEFKIPYEVITRGENKGRLRVKPIRDKDRFNLIETASRLKKMGYGDMVDHQNCFRDEDDNTVCTFSPYAEDRMAQERFPGLKVSKYSIYGMWTKTFAVVVRS